MNSEATGMLALIERLFPICRSITGDGVRETLKILREQIPLEIHEVPTGTKVFDWEVPREWNIRDAWIKDSKGRKIVDFRTSNLHVVSYSVPVHQKLLLTQLREHLFTLPKQRDLVPYRTSYYREDWGFCLSEKILGQMHDDEEYEVLIDSSLEPGHLTYGELRLPGREDDEFLFSVHICHPSLADDNLSGIAVATAMARELKSRSERRYSYRFLFIPGTIGAITWLARNEAVARKIKHGLVLTCLGDRAPLTYKRSRQGNAQVDQAVAYVLRESGAPHEVIDFSPYGYDERQYCSPGFNLPVGRLTRARHGEFPEYHTSADDLDFVTAESLSDSLEKVRAVIDLLEHEEIYVNRNPKCEPQLGRRGLYSSCANEGESRQFELALLWVLNLSDGRHSLLAIAERARLPLELVQKAAQALAKADLLVAK